MSATYTMPDRGYDPTCSALQALGIEVDEYQSPADLRTITFRLPGDSYHTNIQYEDNATEPLDAFRLRFHPGGTLRDVEPILDVPTELARLYQALQQLADGTPVEWVRAWLGAS